MKNTFSKQTRQELKSHGFNKQTIDALEQIAGPSLNSCDLAWEAGREILLEDRELAKRLLERVEYVPSSAKQYKTNSMEYPAEHRNVYHDHDDCPDGKRILPGHRESGTGSKPRCKACIRLSGHHLFSSCWAGHHRLIKPLKAFLHTITAETENLPSPRPGARRNDEARACAVRIGRCLAERNIDLKNYEGGRASSPSKFLFAIRTIFGELKYEIALSSSRRYVADAIAQLRREEDFRSMIPSSQRDHFKSISQRLPQRRKPVNGTAYKRRRVLGRDPSRPRTM